MPVRHISADYGILNPEDLLFLQGILDEVCAANGPMDDGEPAAVAARKLLAPVQRRHAGSGAAEAVGSPKRPTRAGGATGQVSRRQWWSRLMVGVRH